MFSKKLKPLYLFNVLGFLTVFTLVSLMLFYQLFVYPDYRFIPLSKFFQPQFLTKVINSLFHQHQPPTAPSTIDNQLIVQPDCQDICYFNIINTNDSSLIKRLPAIVDINAAGRLKDLKLAFFDGSRGLIGYQSVVTENPVFYVINFDQELLQAIQLRINNQIDISFVDYYPDTAEMLFSSINHATGQQQQFLYSATSPSLKVLVNSKR